MVATWIFQANPDRFDIDGFLSTKPTTLTWLVSRYGKQIAVGDRVFIWRAVGKGDKDESGVIAEALVLMPVRPQTDAIGADGFWKNFSEASVIRDRVHLRLVKIAKDRKSVVKRRWLIDDPILSDLIILKMANATNYRVTTDQAIRLNALWSNTGRNWNYGESVAGLWAYNATYGRPVSSVSGSPVAQIALTIGRAVPGCYNKIMNFRHLDPRDSREGLSGGSEIDERVWAIFFDKQANTVRGGALLGEFNRLWSPISDLTPVGQENTHQLIIEAEVSRLSSLTLKQLSKRYAEASVLPAAKPKVLNSSVKRFVRDAIVIAIAQVRAKFSCEVPGCANPLFISADGTPYVEVHHISPLGEGGDDTPANVACICPSHHREVHLGRAATSLRRQLELIRDQDESKIEPERLQSQ
jgi:hypothetical protein